MVAAHIKWKLVADGDDKDPRREKRSMMHESRNTKRCEVHYEKAQTNIVAYNYKKDD